MSETWLHHPRLRHHFHSRRPSELRVLLHDGGRSLTGRPPELAWVRVTGRHGQVFEGRVLDAPERVRGTRAGDAILFLAPHRAPHPIQTDRAYLRERRQWLIEPCVRCGLNELFDAPSRLLERSAQREENRRVGFSTPCPLCPGRMRVRPRRSRAARRTRRRGPEAPGVALATPPSGSHGWPTREALPTREELPPRESWAEECRVARPPSSAVRPPAPTRRPHGATARRSGWTPPQPESPETTEPEPVEAGGASAAEPARREDAPVLRLVRGPLGDFVYWACVVIPFCLVCMAWPVNYMVGFLALTVSFVWMLFLALLHGLLQRAAQRRENAGWSGSGWLLARTLLDLFEPRWDVALTLRSLLR